MTNLNILSFVFVHTCPAVSSSRYDNTGGGAIEVISPASSPVQSQQDKPDEGQQQAASMSKPTQFEHIHF